MQAGQRWDYFQVGDDTAGTTMLIEFLSPSTSKLKHCGSVETL